MPNEALGSVGMSGSFAIYYTHTHTADILLLFRIHHHHHHRHPDAIIIIIIVMGIQVRQQVHNKILLFSRLKAEMNAALAHTHKRSYKLAPGRDSNSHPHPHPHLDPRSPIPIHIHITITITINSSKFELAAFCPPYAQSKWQQIAF